MHLLWTILKHILIRRYFEVVLKTHVNQNKIVCVHITYVFLIVFGQKRGQALITQTMLANIKYKNIESSQFCPLAKRRGVKLNGEQLYDSDSTH